MRKRVERACQRILKSVVVVVDFDLDSAVEAISSSAADDKDALCVFLPTMAALLSADLPGPAAWMLQVLADGVSREVWGGTLDVQDLLGTPKSLHNKRGGKEEWKLLLWAINAGWGDLIGMEPERRS